MLFGYLFKLSCVALIFSFASSGQSRIHSLGKLSHPNLVKFLGYCEEKELFVVHEFMQNGSLDNHLFAGEIWIILF